MVCDTHSEWCEIRPIYFYFRPPLLNQSPPPHPNASWPAGLLWKKQRLVTDQRPNQGKWWVILFTEEIIFMLLLLLISFLFFLQWILFLSLVLYIPVFVNRYLLYLLSIKMFDNSEENLILKRSVLFIKISRERFLQTPAGCWIFYRVHFSLWCEIRFLLLWH